MGRSVIQSVALVRGERSQDNRDEFFAMTADLLGCVSAGAIAQGRSLRPAIALDDSVVASEQELADAFADSGQLQGQVDFAKFVDNRYDEALAPLFGTPQS